MPGDLRQPWHGPAILHVDLDAFFAAVEQLDHPEWRGKPVIVGGDASRRGVVSTASYEARKYGVRSAMPSARAAQLVPDAIWAKPRFDRYVELSRAVRAIFADESPFVQPVSIDEAYLDVTPGKVSAEEPVEIAKRIRARVAELGITASVGLASAKSVAKIASDVDKPDGLTVVPPGTEAAFLAPMDVRAMPGIGPRSAERLHALGIRTLGDLAALDDETARQLFGSHGESLVLRARGIDGRSVHVGEPAKSVSNERTFAVDMHSRKEVLSALSALSAKVGHRLRTKELAGRTVTVKLRFSDFTTRTVQRTLPEPVDDEVVFGPIADELLESAWTPGVGLRLLGVGVSGFDSRATQLSLIAEEPSSDSSAPQISPRRERLARGLDAVKERFGDDAVRYGSEVRSAHRRADTYPSGDEETGTSSAEESGSD